MRRASIQDVEAHNLASALQIIRAEGPLSQVQITASLGLSPAAVSRITQRLTSTGLIVEDGKISGKIGRRATLLRINSSGAQLLAVLIGIQSIKMALVDLHNRILCQREDPIDLPVDPADVVAEVRRGSRSMLDEVGSDASKLVGAGVAFGGIVDPTSGVAVGSDIWAGWMDVPLRSQLEAALEVPVVLDHTARIRAWAEHIKGAARGCSNVFYVLGGHAGIGAALILDGKLHQGASSASGEFGHTVIDPKGRACRCGNRGCLEAHASGQAILGSLQSRLAAGAESVLAGGAGPLRVSEVSAAAIRGDSLARQALEEAGECLARGIIGSIWLLDPEVVVLGGPLFSECPYLAEATRSSLAAYQLIHDRQAVPVALSTLTDADALTGVADLAASRYLSSLAGVFALREAD